MRCLPNRRWQHWTDCSASTIHESWKDLVDCGEFLASCLPKSFNGLTLAEVSATLPSSDSGKVGNIDKTICPNNVSSYRVFYWNKIEAGSVMGVVKGDFLVFCAVCIYVQCKIRVEILSHSYFWGRRAPSTFAVQTNRSSLLLSKIPSLCRN